VCLQPLMCCDCKKDSCKTSMRVIATLPQCDCNLITVCLQLKKTVAKTGKKVRLQKNQFKKSSMSWHCQIATRLVFSWCCCNLVKIRVIAKQVKVWLQPLMCCDCKNATWWKYGWLQKKLKCGYNHWCAAIAKKAVAKNSVWLRLQKNRKTVEKNR
jgi:hypothetical protein